VSSNLLSRHSSKHITTRKSPHLCVKGDAEAHSAQRMTKFVEFLQFTIRLAGGSGKLKVLRRHRRKP
jgi:hypothetical protein